MEWALMVVAIVGITTYAKVYRAKHGIGCADRTLKTLAGATTLRPRGFGTRCAC